MANGYNGWTNYETWSIALFIDNDESLYNQLNEAKKGFKKDFYAFANWIKDWVYDFLDVGNLNVYQQQLINSTLQEVNYSELAKSYLEEND